MADAKTFKCPSCGSALEPDGDAKEIKCAFCGSTVIVPEELRDQDEEDLTDEEAAELDRSAPSHLPWLIQHGGDATAKINEIKDWSENHNMTEVDLHFEGKMADGKRFYGLARATVPPLTAIPRRGTMVKIKYNPAYPFTDFAFQVDGQFYFNWP